MILHVDFLLLQKGKQVKMNIPVRLVGSAPGVQKGGKLTAKLRKITIKSLPENLPDFIDVDVSKLELGKSIKVGDLKQDKYTILNNASIPVASVQIPRVVKEETPTADTTATTTPAAETKTEGNKEAGKDKK
jgi:large subunit ribosomal protein L25